ncbi:MAG: LUD domain-containing protein, partial [Verrucomicrobiota bacterium]
MKDDRDAIFQSIEKALKTTEKRTPLPEYEESDCVALPRLSKASNWDNFAHNFSAVSGRPLDSVASLIAFFKTEEATFGYCDPALRETLGQTLEANGLTMAYEFDRQHIDDYHFGITRASAAIAETGTVMLTDGDTSDRLAALAPWIHIAVLESSDGLLRTVGDAIRLFGREPN